jgi:hypothetical protein
MCGNWAALLPCRPTSHEVGAAASLGRRPGAEARPPAGQPMTRLVVRERGSELRADEVSGGPWSRRLAAAAGLHQQEQRGDPSERRPVCRQRGSQSTRCDAGLPAARPSATDRRRDPDRCFCRSAGQSLLAACKPLVAIVVVCCSARTRLTDQVSATIARSWASSSVPATPPNDSCSSSRAVNLRWGCRRDPSGG